MKSQGLHAPQKYSLQRRDGRGFFVKVDTMSEIIGPEEVLKRYGSGYYVLRATKPRFTTVWKQNVGTQQERSIQALEKGTRRLAYGFIGLAATEVISLGATYWKFTKTDERLDKIETILQLEKPTGFNCVACGSPLNFYLQKYCSRCGGPIVWPRKYLPSLLSAGNCSRCRFPLTEQQVFCPNCGQQNLVSQLPFHKV